MWPSFWQWNIVQGFYRNKTVNPRGGYQFSHQKHPKNPSPSHITPPITKWPKKILVGEKICTCMKIPREMQGNADTHPGACVCIPLCSPAFSLVFLCMYTFFHPPKFFLGHFGHGGGGWWCVMVMMLMCVKCCISVPGGLVSSLFVSGWATYPGGTARGWVQPHLRGLTFVGVAHPGPLQWPGRGTVR